MTKSKSKSKSKNMKSKKKSITTQKIITKVNTTSIIKTKRNKQKNNIPLAKIPITKSQHKINSEKHSKLTRNNKLTKPNKLNISNKKYLSTNDNSKPFQVQLSKDGPLVAMSLDSLLFYFPTIQLKYDENFLSKKTSNKLLNSLIALKEKNGILTTEDTRVKYAICNFNVSLSWVQGKPWDTFGDPEETSLLKGLRDSINKRLNWEPNYALVNIYRDGKDEIMWHADNSEGVIPNSSIASVTVGAERTFLIRPYFPGNRGTTDCYPLISIKIKNSSLLVMGQETNEYWCHSLEKENINKARVNITLRCLEEEKDLNKTLTERSGTQNYKRLEDKYYSYNSKNHPLFDNENLKQLLLNNNTNSNTNK